MCVVWGGGRVGGGFSGGVRFLLSFLFLSFLFRFGFGGYAYLSIRIYFQSFRRLILCYCCTHPGGYLSSYIG